MTAWKEGAAPRNTRHLLEGKMRRHGCLLGSSQAYGLPGGAVHRHKRDGRPDEGLSGPHEPPVHGGLPLPRRLPARSCRGDGIRDPPSMPSTGFADGSRCSMGPGWGETRKAPDTLKPELRVPESALRVSGTPLNVEDCDHADTLINDVVQRERSIRHV